MITQLRDAKEIAVDLEHHDYRTYTGILCLMQISTRQVDFIVDLLDPEIRLEIGDGEGLRQIFLDPSVVKVTIFLT
jgi:exosome complex exonuclease RRP6